MGDLFLLFISSFIYIYIFNPTKFTLNGQIYIFHEANATAAFPGAVYNAVVYSTIVLFYCLSLFKLNNKEH